MKKTILLTVVISAFFLAGCTTNNQTAVQEPNQVEDSQPTNVTQESAETSEITEKTGDGFLIPEVGIEIAFPSEYTITKSNETNRRGSFVSYDFIYKSPLPTFQEIQFFSEESIKQFTANCDVDSPCFFGDYPDLERYNGQKNAFNSGNDYGKYEFKKFGDRNYFVSNFKCTGDSCVIREYTTFIDGNKIDTWITLMDDTQVNAADSLFKEFEIIE
jgi:hypothetical protein